MHVHTHQRTKSFFVCFASSLFSHVHHHLYSFLTLLVLRTCLSPLCASNSSMPPPTVRRSPSLMLSRERFQAPSAWASLLEHGDKHASTHAISYDICEVHRCSSGVCFLLRTLITGRRTSVLLWGSRAHQSSAPDTHIQCRHHWR